MGSNPILVDIFVHTWVREAKKLYQQPTKGESDKCHLQNTKKGFPTPGIEPGPPGWEPGILTTRPYRTDVRDAQLGRRYTLVLQKQESTFSLLSSIGETAQPIMSMPLWRNRLARSAVNREAGGSSPPRGAIFFSLSPCQRKGASGGQQGHPVWAADFLSFGM